MDTLSIIVVVVLVIVLLAVATAAHKVEYVNYGQETVRANCTWHEHTFFTLIWEEWYPQIGWVTHLWECTSETCPTCGRACERKGHPGNPGW